MQTVRNSTHRCDENPDSHENIKSYAVTKLKMICSTSEAQMSKFKKLFSILNESDVYVPIEFRKFVTCSNKNEFRWLVSKLQEKGFPYILQDFKLYHYSIPSKGPHEAVQQR